MTDITALDSTSELVAAVDLGSNSFHMIICQVTDGQIKVIDRLKEMVRLASGLNEKNIINEDTQQRALACLKRFGQRIENFSATRVRIVGTNTLRMAKNSAEFLAKAEAALGYSIHIISGIEEARLIYQGVANSLQTNANRRLVMDIGGGSTEYIIGTHIQSSKKESLNMGCVTISQRFFKAGIIETQQFKKAVIFVKRHLNAHKKQFNYVHWDEAIGASGSIRAVCKILIAHQWCQNDITLEGLEKFKQHALNCKHVSQLNFLGLDEERLPVIMGGFVILYTTFKVLGIQSMSVSDGALREGLIYDYLGRLANRDVRSETVKSLALHYHTDNGQANLIKQTIARLVKQVEPFLGEHVTVMAQYLMWAAELHEIGRNIAHSQYHKHGAYVIKHGDLSGFSQKNQTLLSLLVLNHRRKISLKKLKALSKPWDTQALYMIVILRLAVILQRNRSSTAVPDFEMTLNKTTLCLIFPEQWLDNAPLTHADLQQEADYLKPAGITLSVS